MKNDSIQEWELCKDPSPRGSIPAAERPTSLDIAWAAGIYEGEGSSRCTSNRPNSGQQASVYQKDAWLVERLLHLFGGSHYIRKDGGHDWVVSGPRARGFLMTIYKFLSPRRKSQVRKALGVEL